MDLLFKTWHLKAQHLLGHDFKMYKFVFAINPVKSIRVVQYNNIIFQIF